jgi:hypothetical protein
METDDQKASSHAESDASSGDQNQNKNKDSVSLDSFRKSVDQEKKARAKAQELEAKVKEYERKELEEKGEYSKVTEGLRQEIKEKDERNQRTLLAARNHIVNQSIRNKALETGANPDAIDLILKAEDWSGVTLSDDLVPDEDVIAEKISNLAKTKTFLFSKKGGQVNEVAINTSKAPKKSYKEMSKEELNAEFLRVSKK